MGRQKAKGYAKSLNVTMKDENDQITLTAPDGFMFAASKMTQMELPYTHGNKAAAWETVEAVLESGLAPDVWRGHFVGSRGD